MRPIKILGIAPYEGIASLMQQAAESRTDLQIDVHVGDLAAGAEIAAVQAAEQEYDVILSRGGTAEAIRRSTDLKVVDIPLSVYDILRSIKLAENHNCKYAVIGFPAITRNATFLCEVLRYNMDIYTIHNQAEACTILQELESSGCQMVLCDVVTNALAQEYGIPALLITSGIESVEDALNTAVQEGLAHRKALELAQFFQDVIRAMPYDTLVSDEAGQDLFVSLSPELPDSVLAKAHSAIMQRTAESHCSCIEEDGIRYALQSTPIQMEGALRHIVTIEKSRLSIPLEKYGITYADRQQAVDTFFDSFYGITQSFSCANLTLEQYLQNNRPLVVYGEPGTSKPQMVWMLYAKGPLSNAPLVKIDCAMLMQPGWKYLMENDRSPLMGDGCTIMISHVEALTDERFTELFSTVAALHTQERNRMFFIASCPSTESMHPHYARLVDMLNCLTLEMPPLRSHLQDIPRLSGLYISTLNMRNARAVIGFEPEATLCMTQYCWPGNYDQFCRVLDELVLRTTTPYISVETVRGQLKRERIFYPEAVPQTRALPMDLTLEQIEHIAVQQALQAENGNQKRAAERLGISRTTLWRMLQRETPHPAHKK